MSEHWKTLDPEKIRRGVAACAKALGQEVTSPRNLSSVKALHAALAPYLVLAHLTLKGGAFGYTKTALPSDAEVMEVQLDFLRAVGEADEQDDVVLREAIQGTRS